MLKIKLAILAALMLLIGIIALVSNDNRPVHPIYKENDTKVAELMKITMHKDGTREAELLDYTRSLHTEASLSILKRVIDFYQIQGCDINIYQRHRYKRSFTRKRALYRPVLLESIPWEILAEKFKSLTEQHSEEYIYAE